MKSGKWFLRMLAFISVFVNFLLAESGEIKVDASKDMGSIPGVLSSSIWIDNPQSKDIYILSKFFKENKPATIQLTIPLGGTDFDSFKKELKDYLNNEGISIIIKMSKEYNSTLIVGFDPAPMRPWLSSRRSDERGMLKSGGFTLEQSSPPADYSLWGEVVKYTLNFFKKDLGIKNLGIYVGHEPNRDWLGTEESFFKYYEFTARAAKSISETILVGGIGTWNVQGEKVDCGCADYAPYVQEICRQEGGWAGQGSMVKNFINYVANHHLPLDFINWHSFGELPKKFPETANTIRGWLKEAGIEEKEVKLYPSDWTYWADAYPADYLDTQESAAYIIQSIYSMWKAGIDWHGHDFNVFDGGFESETMKERQNATFIGDWSLFTWGGKLGGGIIKPMYNALKALSMVTREDGGVTRRLISTEFPKEETVIAFSTLTGDKRKISLIVSNFIPQNEERLKRYILSEVETQISFLEEGKLIKKCIEENKDDMKNRRDIFFQCKDKLIASLKDPKKIEVIDFIAKAYVCLNSKNGLECILNSAKELKYPDSVKIADKIICPLKARNESKEVRVCFANIPFLGKARLIAYKIDSNYGSAGSFNKKTEPVKTRTPCGIGGAIDRAVWDARQESRAKAEEAARAYLLSKGYSSTQINELEMLIKRRSPNLKERLKNNNLSVEKRADIMMGFRKYSEVMQKNYYNKIDCINNSKEISLEGSKEVKEIDVEKGTFAMDISLEPNSIYLLIVEKN